MEEHKPFATFDLRELKNKEIKNSHPKKTIHVNTTSKPLELKDSRPLFSAVTPNHIKQPTKLALLPLSLSILGCLGSWLMPPLLGIILNLMGIYTSFQKKRKDHKYIGAARILSILGLTMTIALLIAFSVYWTYHRLVIL